VQNIAETFKALSMVQQRYRRQTDGRTAHNIRRTERSNVRLKMWHNSLIYVLFSFLISA